MTNKLIAALALGFAVALAPLAASAHPSRHRHHHHGHHHHHHHGGHHHHHHHHH
ncbi:MAG TPA: hypothetical protein VIG55_06100 [Methylosinus sp.]